MATNYPAARIIPNEDEDDKYNDDFMTPFVTAQKTATIRTIDNKYASTLENPDLQNISWEDTFFDDEDDVVAVFDYDYEAIEKFNTSTGYAALASTLIYPPLFFVALGCGAPCFLPKNVSWNARAQHVAITRDGIRYVQDRRKTGWGLSCTDRGKESKTVPFDKITDCDVVEPAGNSCICIPNILSYVNIDTASSGQNGLKELRLAGLKKPQLFKKLVWAMKRSQREGGGPSAMEMTGRGAGSEANGGQDNVTSILLQIRDELRTHNELLHRMNPSGSENKPNEAAAAAATVTAIPAIAEALSDSVDKTKTV